MWMERERATSYLTRKLLSTTDKFPEQEITSIEVLAVPVITGQLHSLLDCPGPGLDPDELSLLRAMPRPYPRFTSYFCALYIYIYSYR